MNTVRNSTGSIQVATDKVQTSVSEISNGMKRSNQSGSHIIALALAVLVVGLIAFAGYRVYQMQQTANSPSSSTTASTLVPVKITNTATLKQAGTALDAASVQLDASLDDSSLNTAVNSML